MKTDNPKPRSGKEENGDITSKGAAKRKGGPFDWSSEQEEEKCRAERMKAHDNNETSGYGGSL